MWFVKVFPAYDGGVFEGSGGMDSGGKMFYCGDEAGLEEVLDVHVVYDCFWSKVTTGEEESVHGITDESMLQNQRQWSVG